MGGLLTTGSILAAFFGGAVALFSPCCIVFLFPAYLASAVKARRWRLLPITLVFAAGIGLVLIPITLGIGMVATSLARYHRPLYVVGGLLMLGLAYLALSGHSWNVPSFIRAPDVERSDAPGVFAVALDTIAGLHQHQRRRIALAEPAPLSAQRSHAARRPAGDELAQR